MTAEIAFFMPDRPYGWLSALSRHPVEAEGICWPTAEHYYQSRKFPAHPAIQAKIAAEPDPFLAKAIAKLERAHRPANWHPDLALDAFRAACRLKFTQHPDLAAALRATGDAQLIEAAPDDDYWGMVCLRPAQQDETNRAEADRTAIGEDGPQWVEQNWVGQNWVGRILMEIRAGLI